MTAPDTSPAAIAELLEGVTPGPWHELFDEYQTVQCSLELPIAYHVSSRNAHFIAASRELVPALSAERDRLAAQVVQLQRDLDAANARAVKVKPLVWCHHPMGFIASPPTGQAYIIDIRIKGRVMFIKGMNPPPQFDNLEDAKAAAQADYEARILSALEKPHD